jgi:hypothetical protein
MQNYPDIKKLLLSVENYLRIIQTEYELAKKDEEVDEIFGPTLKSAFENLRSCLDYCAWAIHEKYLSTRSEKQIYFPYQRTKSDFENRIKKVFPALKSTDISSILESIQPYACGDNWLIDLCEITNSNKHRKLSQQKRVNSMITTKLPGITLKGNVEATFINSRINGVLVGDKKPLVINNKISLKDIQKEVPGLKISRTPDSIEFQLDGTNIDAYKLIEKAYFGIKDMVEKLHSALSS